MYMEFTPDDANCNATWALEPQYDSPVNQKAKTSTGWPMVQKICAVDNNIRLLNSTSEPIMLCNNEHTGQVRSILPTKESVRPSVHVPCDEQPHTTAMFESTVNGWASLDTPLN